MNGFDIYSEQKIDMLSAEMKKLVANAYRAKCFAATGCMREGGFGDFGKFPQADMERISIYRGGDGFGTYDHAPCFDQVPQSVYFSVEFRRRQRRCTRAECAYCQKF